MQLLSQSEINTVDGGSFLRSLFGASVYVVKKLIPSSKNLPNINNAAEMGVYQLYKFD